MSGGYVAGDVMGRGSRRDVGLSTEGDLVRYSGATHGRTNAANMVSTAPRGRRDDMAPMKIDHTLSRAIGPSSSHQRLLTT